MKRFASVMLMLCVLAVPSLAATYYAAPAGTGSGKSADSPANMAAGTALLKTGDLLLLADGTYTGASGMLVVNGKHRVTIRAVNDGGVLIDGQKVHEPIRLTNCSYVLVQGVDACNSRSSVVEANYSYACTFRRVCAWDAADGNDSIMSAHYSGQTTFEDCAGWGMARKIFTASQGGNQTTFLRCWGRWEGCTAVGTKCVISANYNSWGTKVINCVGTWDTSTGRMPDTYVLKDYYGQPWTGPEGGTFRNRAVQGPAGIFASEWYYPQNSNYAGVLWAGCIAYVLPTQELDWFSGGFIVTRNNGHTLLGCHSSIKGAKQLSYAFLLSTDDRRADGGTDLTARNLAHYGGPVRIGRAPDHDVWKITNMVATLPVPKTRWQQTHEGDCNGDGVVNVGDLGVISGNYGKDCFYKDGPLHGDVTHDGHCNVTDLGVLSGNYGKALPLWPWPMDGRIKAAMARGGYPPFEGVTHQVEQALGQTLLPEEPKVSTITIYPISGGMWRYHKTSDLVPGATYLQVRNDTGGDPVLTTDNLSAQVHSYFFEEEGEQAVWIDRSAWRFSLLPVEGKQIQSISLRLNGPNALIAGRAQVVQTSLLADMSLGDNYARILSQGTGAGAIVLVSGTEYKVDLPAVYAESMDLAIMENDHDYAGLGGNHDEQYSFTSEGAERPRLVIAYTDPAPAGPPVGTLSLMGVGR